MKPEWKLVEKRLGELKSLPDNSKIHDEEQINEIKQSIESFGYLGTIIIDKMDTIVSGHGTAEALKRIYKASEALPFIQLQRDYSQAELDAMSLALNQLTRKTGYDQARLRTQLARISEAGIALKPLGFQLSEIKSHLRKLELDPVKAGYIEPEPDPKEDEVPEPKEPFVKPGELWQLGEHRLLCGDATKKEDVERLMSYYQCDCGEIHD